LTPGSVLIEISGSNYARSNVLCRDGIVFTLVANLAPVVKAIFSRGIADLVRQGISIGEAGLLAFMQTHGGPLSGRLALALPNRHYSRVSGGVNIEAVVAGLGHGEGLVRSVDLVDFSAIKFVDVYIQSALVQLHLHGVIGDVGQSQTGFGADSHHARAQIQFGARIFIGPDIVADGQGAVQRAFNPIARPLGLNRNRSGHVSQTSCPARRINLLASRGRHGLICGRRRRLLRRIGRLIANRSRRLVCWRLRCLIRRISRLLIRRRRRVLACR
jgi:hypothetical protein